MKNHIERMIRVDQAGEFGATRIYAGQLAVMGDRAPHSGEIAAIRSLMLFKEELDKFGRSPACSALGSKIYNYLRILLSLIGVCGVFYKLLMT